jgi:hypothetical protein
MDETVCCEYCGYKILAVLADSLALDCGVFFFCPNDGTCRNKWINDVRGPLPDWCNGPSAPIGRVLGGKGGPK